MLNSLNDDFIRKLRDTVRKVERYGQAPTNQPFRVSPGVPIPIQNGSGEEIPAHAAMQITATKIINDTRFVITVGKPDGSGGPFLFNYDRPIPIDGVGFAQPGPVVRSIYDTTETITTGETWGPASGSWEVSSTGDAALIIYGQSRDVTDSELLIGSMQLGGGTELKIGKTDAEITAGSFGTVSIWENDASADTGENVTAYLDWMTGNENVSSNKEVLIAKFGDIWRIIGAECEAETPAEITNPPTSITSIDWSTATQTQINDFLVTTLITYLMVEEP